MIEMTVSERLAQMGIGTVIGIATVFAILIFLWGFLVVMKYVFNRQPKAEKKAEEIASAPSTPVQDDTQLIAVLTAAVAMMMEAQNITTGFKIKSFRRTK